MINDLHIYKNIIKLLKRHFSVEMESFPIYSCDVCIGGHKTNAAAAAEIPLPMVLEKPRRIR